jgi:hypothetical protein
MPSDILEHAFVKVLRGIAAEAAARRRKKKVARLMQLWRQRHMKDPLLAGIKEDKRSHGLPAERRRVEALLEVAAEAGCRCGRGWCEVHGTDDLSDSLELAEVERVEVTTTPGSQGCRGGRRVDRRPVLDWEERG